MEKFPQDSCEAIRYSLGSLCVCCLRFQKLSFWKLLTIHDVLSGLASVSENEKCERTYEQYYDFC